MVNEIKINKKEIETGLQLLLIEYSFNKNCNNTIKTKDKLNQIEEVLSLFNIDYNKVYNNNTFNVKIE